MTIYIEYFLLQNIIINFCLIRLVCITTKSKTTNFRMILASVIGASFSVIVAIFITNTLAINLLKLMCSLCIVLVAFKQTKKGFVFNLILLFLYTYALGGLITSLSSTTYYTSFGMVTSSKFNLWTITLLVVALTYIFEMVAKHIKIKLKTNNLIYKTTLIKNKKKITINAFLDTGNMLNYNGSPVIVVDLNAYLKLTNSNLLEFLTNKSEEIKAGTIAGNNSLKIFVVDEITIFKDRKQIHLKNQYIAVNTNANFNKNNYQALLSPFVL